MSTGVDATHLGAGPRFDWRRAVRRAQQGSAAARDEVLAAFLPLVLGVARRTCGRQLRLGSDDEASVALIALNEAIDHYRPRKGKSFSGFVQMVVRHRVIDTLRREGARNEIPVAHFVQTPAGEQEGEEVPALRKAEFRHAMAAYRRALDAVEGREEVRAYVRALRCHGIGLDQVVRVCPRRCDARERAIAVARAVADDPGWREHLRKRKSLPLKQMAADPDLGVSRKTLERHRTYIVAVALLFLHREGRPPPD